MPVPPLRLFCFIMAKDTFYFSHDFNSRQDAKIKKLLMKHGLCGYGLFWSIIEDLYNNANALPTDYDSIAYDLRTDVDTVKSVVLGFGLFVVDGDQFGSLSVQKRLDERAERSKKARDSANKRWNIDANALPPQSEPNARKESKEEEIKKKKVEKEFNVFWDSYGKKLDSKTCKAKWLKLTDKERAAILEHVPKYVRATPDKQYRKNPSTYLNQRTWEDEELPTVKGEEEKVTGSSILKGMNL